MNAGVVTILQARTGSSRLPGKILLPLGRGTVLDVLISRVKLSRQAGTIVVATTTDPIDDPIIDIAERNRVAHWRGHPTDLLDRHYTAAAAMGARHVVKIPSDCPLIDPVIIDDVIAWYLERPERFDYVSNLHPPTHPDGNDVEIMSFKVLEAAWREAVEPHEREHTTPFIWNHQERFRVGNVRWSGRANAAHTHRVVLDYREDYEAIRATYEALVRVDPQFGVDDVVRFLDDHPEVASLNSNRLGSAWYVGMRAKLPGLEGWREASEATT